MPTSKNPVLALFFLFIFMSFSFGESPLDVAKRHLQNQQQELGLTSNDIANYLISDHYTSSHNGVTHVYFKQTHNNIEVHNSIININVLSDGKILNIGNRFVANLASRVNTINASISKEIAVKKLLQHYELQGQNTPLVIKENRSENHVIYENEGIALEPIPVKLVYQLMDDKTVRLAWNVKVYTLDAQNWYNARIDAQTGELLDVHNQVLHCEFGAPHNNCVGHMQPAKSSNRLPAPFIQNYQNEAKNSSANTYNVYPLTVESPNHGNRQLVSNPADPTASPFGWHDTNGQTGAEYTITRGNNTHAYHDIFDNNFSSGDEPDGGATLDFDFPIDLTTNAPYTYVDGAVTNLFFWCNLMHDVWYNYGFDEDSGNFQENNYGNGGIDGDHVQAEAMDGSGTSNANFSSDEDGTTARIQMYLWTNDALPDAPDQDLVISSPSSVAGTYEMSPGQFGAPLPNPALTGLVVEANDGVAPNTDACTPLMNGAAISGNIALIDRGDCEFGTKCLEAQNNGAIAVIICNNVADPIFPMGGGNDGGAVNIPCVMVSQADCAIIRVELANSIQAEIGQTGSSIPIPGPSGVTGDLDNGIISHEYGHGISIRLTGGPNTGSCLGNIEQAGEGWSDWFSLVMTGDPNAMGPDARGIGTYALVEPTSGPGIRTHRYSTDMSINPHTYADINNESVPHGVGSVWCATIWDLYWRLVDEYNFDADLYNGTGGNNMAMQLVMDGLKLQSCNPSFIDSRDGILAADVANYNGVNQCLIWEVFARRGLGYSATAGGNEAFDLAPSCLETLKISKTAEAEVDAGDVITYTFVVTNDVQMPLTDVTVLDTLPSGVTYIAGSASCPNTTINGNIVSISIGTMNTGDVSTCTFQVTAAASPFTAIFLEDDMENGGTNWISSIGTGIAQWTLNDNNPNTGTFAWYAENIDTESDQYLDLATPLTLMGANPALSFYHYYDTESTWDGGVVELSVDQGASWIDMGPFMTKNGYNGQLQDNPASPLSERDAFHGKSPGYIETIIDLADFSGADAIVRFRLGCDGYVGADGWYIDDVRFLDLVAVENNACVASNEGETACDGVSTTILDPEIASSIIDLADLLDVNIYPNPVDELLNVRFNTNITNELTWELVSVDGKLLRSNLLTANNSSLNIDVSDIPAGIYMLKLSADEGQSIHKIIIE